MKILVAVKLTFDASQIKFDSSGKPLLDAAPRIMGDADKCAVEEAVRAKEKLGARTAVVTLGASREHERMIRDAYAMGIDEGYMVRIEKPEELSIPSVAELIAGVAGKTGPYDLILLGVGSNDTHSSMLAPMLSLILGYPLLPSIDKLEVKSNGVVGTATLEDGTYKFEAGFPAVVSVTSEANEPRIPTLRAILKSKRVPINQLTPGDLGAEPRKIKIEGLERFVVPRKRVILEAGDASQIEEAIDKLIEELKAEGVF